MHGNKASFCGAVCFKRFEVQTHNNNNLNFDKPIEFLISDFVTNIIGKPHKGILQQMCPWNTLNILFDSKMVSNLYLLFLTWMVYVFNLLDNLCLILYTLNWNDHLNLKNFSRKSFLNLLFTFSSHQGKVTKIPSGHISNTYIHVFCSPY